MARSAHFWTADKLDFLEQYIPAFVHATKRARARYYVDGFAGPGRNVIDGRECDGSPLIALNAREECTQYFFIEQKRRLFEQLSAHTESHPRAARVVSQRGNFNNLVREILPRIPDLAPCLFFLDPEGLELDFATVHQISRRTKADLFILISGFGLVRNIRRPEAAARLTKFFGDYSWQPLLERYEARGFSAGIREFEAFTDFYIGPLAKVAISC